MRDATTNEEENTNSDLPLPLQLDWQDPKPEETISGGENRVIRETLNHDKAKLLSTNTAHVLQAISNALTEQLETNKETVDSETALTLLWQSVRDFNTSLYLAISGRYRHAHIVRRSALEVSAYALYFEENPDDEDTWDKWVGEKPGGTSTNKLKEEMEDVLKETFKNEFAEKTVEEIFNENRTDLHKFVHSIVGGEIERFIDGDNKEASPIHPWSSYFDYEQFKNWYVDFISDMQFLNIIIHKYWDIEGEKGIREETHQILDLIPTMRDLAEEEKIIDIYGEAKETEI